MATELYPLSVRLAGVMHKGTSKMYMTSVLWSDQTEVVVYRSFGDFKKMHKQLKAAFPSASKLNKSDRILPKFKGIKMKKRSQGKGSNKSLVRLKYLQKYCNDLLSCDPRVSQSADLIRFFQPKGQEPQLEFTKNCVMIMPSEDEIRSNGGHSSSGNVTQPFVTETYRCVAAYETKDTKNKPFKVTAEEKLDVLIKDKGGWWLVENENKRMAWFPAPYLEKVEEEEDEDDKDEMPARGMLYTAVKSYKSTNVDEISVDIGAVVEVLQQPQNGWWLIRHNGKMGYIPAIHLQPHSYPHIRTMTPQSQDLNSSSLLAPSSNLHHSRSYGNLPQLPPVTSLSPNLIQDDSLQRSRSRSLSMLSEQPRPQPAESLSASVTNRPAKLASPARPPPPPPPVIMVQDEQEEEEEEEEEEGIRMLAADTDDSFESDSFSDDSGSVSAGSSVNLSYGANEERLRLSRTPPPTISNLLSPTSQPQGRLLPSVSDPNLYKGPSSPKVPPRPRAQEIMNRCCSITRKNAAKLHLPPTQTEVTTF
ncbi:NADPH oxidase organizer 1a [Kryptolebias marmoratus]|uniref:NADPH oxidase organizer 1a n=1 Tax=Kryptolebias marmoratus TaxID=37003 RepID=A0A3Q3BNB8_KRYMA|nr:NADPH oxidase organizer 1a [Kryptolebias marmoratus]